MYLGIDIGGTKTLLASLDEHGVIQRSEKFSTPLDYHEFLKMVKEWLVATDVKQWHGAGVGVPAPVHYPTGSVGRMANLPWHDIAIQKDIQEIAGCAVQLENDANLAGLSEAMLVKDRYNKVLYITISTGIGSGVINHQRIDPHLADSEPGHMFLEKDGKLQRWETFASGRAIYEKYGQYAQEIYDSESWQEIAENIGRGLLVLEAALQPEIIILGGSIGTHFERYKAQLEAFMAAHVSPQVPLRPLMQAQRPEEAVLFGCYDLVKQHH